MKFTLWSPRSLLSLPGLRFLVGALVVFVLTFLFFLLNPFGPSRDIRNISVCVLDDQSAPVRPEVINMMLDGAFPDFSEKAGIILTAGKIMFFLGEPYPSNWRKNQSVTAFKKICPKGSKIRIIFTNRMAIQREDDTIAESGVGHRIFGLGDPELGFVVMYSVEELFSLKDASGNPAAIAALKHEVTHLFIGNWHSEDPESFMYKDNSSSGKWTDEVVQRLLENKNKLWP